MSGDAHSGGVFHLRKIPPLVLGRLLFAFMLMCAHAFRYAKMFNNAMSFIHLGRCYPPRCPGAAPHSAPARWRYLSRTPVAGLPVTPMASL